LDDGEIIDKDRASKRFSLTVYSEAGRDQLQGTKPDIDNDSIKKYIFDYFMRSLANQGMKITNPFSTLDIAKE